MTQSIPTPSNPDGDPAASVLIVDDDALVRAGLGLILGGCPDLLVVGEAGDGVTGVQMAKDLAPDVILMDVRMPHLDGLAATREILSHRPQARIVVLTTFDADDLVLSALSAGAHGFLLKDTPPARMVEAIRAVVRGEHTLSPSVVTQLINAATAGSTVDASTRAQQALADLALLTDREREVALAIGHGCSNAEIADQLVMSVATVKGHVTRLLEKLHCDNRVQVAIRVHDAGLT